MRLLFPLLLLSGLSYSQSDNSPKGFVANGVVYTLQTMDSEKGVDLTDKDTLQGEFNIIVSESKKFITIEGIEELNNSFQFDTIVIDNLMENEYMAELMVLSKFTQRNEFDFEVDYFDEIIDGKKRPLVVKWLYDDMWNSPKLYISYMQGSKSWFYNFYFEDISYIGWEHGLTFESTYHFNQYGETDTRSGEEVDVFKADDSGTFVVNDTSMVITSEKINLKKNITRSFSSKTEKMFMVQGALFSIPAYSGNWIFYNFDYNFEREAFDGYYYFGIKED